MARNVNKLQINNTDVLVEASKCDDAGNEIKATYSGVQEYDGTQSKYVRKDKLKIKYNNDGTLEITTE